MPYPWYIFILLSATTQSFSNVLDKWMLTNQMSDHMAYAVFVALFYPLVLALSFPFIGPAPPRAIDISVLSGILAGAAYLLYYRAVNAEEISRVGDMVRLDTVFTALLGAVFLGEVLSLTKYAGMALVLFSAFLVGSRRVEGEVEVSESLLWVSVFALLASLAWVLQKVVIAAGPFTVLFWMMVGLIASRLALLLSGNVRRSLREDTADLEPVSLGVGLVISLLVFGTYYFWFVGISMIEVSLAMGLFALQPFILWMLSSALARTGLEIEEDLGIRSQAVKLTAVILVFIGTWLIV